VAGLPFLSSAGFPFSSTGGTRAFTLLPGHIWRDGAKRYSCDGM
jgi:hypothetical protein